MIKYRLLYILCSIFKLYYKDWSLSSTILSVFLAFLLYFVGHVDIIICSKFVMYSMIFYMIVGRIAFLRNHTKEQYTLVCKYCQLLKILIKKQS